MGAAKNLTGMTLRGNRSGHDWTVEEQVKLETSLTPGQFSVGYRVLRNDGLEAFMKASDLSMAFEKDDPLRALREMTTGHEFERSILEHCRGNRLDKVVTALDSGSEQVQFNGASDFVFFIVFEIANGDLRKHVQINEGTNLVWVISAMHNICVAMSQMHGAGVYHNDLKPGNTLVFDNTEKVADLGRASSPSFPVPHDRLLCAGDPRFAPPEQLYHENNESKDIDRFVKSKAGDLYNLGSIMHYLLKKRQVTPEVIRRLDSPFKPARSGTGWTDSYEGVLPYWRESFNYLMEEFYEDLPVEWVEDFGFVIDELRDVVVRLCEPDFRLRGDLENSVVNPSKYSLTRIISKMDNLKSRVIIASRA